MNQHLFFAVNKHRRADQKHHSNLFSEHKWQIVTFNYIYAAAECTGGHSSVDVCERECVYLIHGARVGRHYEIRESQK